MRGRYLSPDTPSPFPVEESDLSLEGEMRELLDWKGERMHFTSKPDRHGTVGELRAEIDDRPRVIRHDFAFIPLEDHLEYFDDDHKRSLNDRIAGGGRDMRSFSLATPERTERLRTLEQKRDELIARLNTYFLPIPVEITARHDQEQQTYKWMDDDRGRMYGSTIRHRLLWGAAGQVIHQEDLGVTEEGDAGTGRLDSQAVTDAWRRGNEIATRELRMLLGTLERIETRPEVVKDKKRLQTVLDEIAVYEGELEVDLPVYLAPNGYSDALRSERIAQQKELWPAYAPRYKPAFDRNPLYLVGLEKALNLYRERGVDPLQEELIDFRGLWERPLPSLAFSDTPLSDEDRLRREVVTEGLNTGALRRINDVRFWSSSKGEEREPDPREKSAMVEQKEREPVSHEEGLRLQREVGRAGLFVDLAGELWKSKSDRGTQRRLQNWRGRSDAFAQALTQLAEADATALRERSEKLALDARQIAMDAARENRKDFQEDWPSVVSEGIGRAAAVAAELDLELTSHQEMRVKDRVTRFVIEHGSAPDEDTVFDWVTDVTA